MLNAQRRLVLRLVEAASASGRESFAYNGDRLAVRARLAAKSAMEKIMNRCFACLLSFLLAGGDIALAQAQTQKIAGDIVSIEGFKLEVKIAGGRTVTVRLADNFRLSARSAADVTKLTPGAYVGATAVPQRDGTLVAREVHVFPESMRGTGEGHRAMEAAEPGSTMTNATIASVGARGGTTNATVAEVSGAADGRALTLTYKGGEKVVVVPDNVPIVMVEPADRSLLVPGAHVVVYAAAQPDGTLVSERLTVGKNGFVPPPL